MTTSLICDPSHDPRPRPPAGRTARPPDRRRGAGARRRDDGHDLVGQAGRAPTANADALIAMAQRELDSVVRQMSPWEPLSDLSRYNRAAAGGWTSLPPAFAQVLRCALEIAEQTDGAFDPTLGGLVDLWGFGPAPSRAPRRKLMTSPRPARPPAGVTSHWTATACSSPATCAWTSTGSPRASRSTKWPPPWTARASARTSSRSAASCAGPAPSPTASRGGSSWSGRPPRMTGCAPWSPCTACRWRPLATTAGSSSTTAAATPTPWTRRRPPRSPTPRSASRCWPTAACAPTPGPRP